MESGNRDSLAEYCCGMDVSFSRQRVGKYYITGSSTRIAALSCLHESQFTSLGLLPAKRMEMNASKGSSSSPFGTQLLQTSCKSIQSPSRSPKCNMPPTPFWGRILKKQSAVPGAHSQSTDSWREMQSIENLARQGMFQ